MFKLICNAGQWETLFEGRTASQELRRFMIKTAGQEGVVENLVVKKLVTIDDPERWGERPRYLILVCERPEFARLIGNSLKIDLAAELNTIAGAQKPEDVFAEIGKLKEYCFELENELCLTNKQGHPPTTISLSERVAMWCLFVFLFVGQIYVLKRGGPPGPVGPQGLSGPPGKQGDQGKEGKQGIQGVKGDTGYVVIKDVGSRVGDIMLVDDSVVAPPGYVKCDGKKIQAENYPDYFSALRLTGRSSRVPELEAPAGKAYIIKVQQ